MRSIAVFALSFLVGAAAIAQDKSGAYIGIGIGQLDYEEEAFGVTLDDTTLAYKIYAGYRFNQTWAVEGSYGQTDDLSWSDNADIPGFGFVTATLSADYEFLEVRGLAHFGWFLVGLGYWDADLSATLYGTTAFAGPFVFPLSDSDSGASLIVGGQWDFDRWGIRGEFEYFDTDSSIDVYTLGVGIHYRF